MPHRVHIRGTQAPHFMQVLLRSACAAQFFLLVIPDSSESLAVDGEFDEHTHVEVVDEGKPGW